ncbi:glucan 1, 4-alpha-glucosidase [Immersiella caudata]|uniref:Glucoamylase n=1 Tax=Immersiella caudata TaxID=314043 RepID=A0AA39X2H2_9PEZI|nr:glucan 1, 4-alpha-glucosidase [Immersiella caudata]
MMAGLAVNGLEPHLTPQLANLTSSSFGFFQPTMHALSSLLLLGVCAVQTVFGRPEDSHARRDAQILRRSVDSFIEAQTPVSWERLFCNIGADGCRAQGVAPSVCVASPSKQNPDYWYTWTRDSALVFKNVAESFAHSYNSTFQRHLNNFLASQAKLQTVANPVGDLSNGAGLGEAKFYVDLTKFTGEWGRPQRDGPPLRAIALMTYAKWLVANGYTATARDVIWPAVKNDLQYTAQYWNQTGFDLWEEVPGSSFFTITSSHRALVEGAALAKSLGLSCPACTAVAPRVLCFVQSFWNQNQGYVVSNINGGEYRNGRDANSILASIHNFDPTIGCDANTFQPCSDKALSNHKSTVDSFRSIYTINRGIPQNKAVAIGRYSEDVYYNGNPWYLTTLAAAEQLYDAIIVWKQQGSITVTPLSLAFFRALVPSVNTGTFASSSSTYTAIIDAVQIYADEFLAIIDQRKIPGGSIPEQFDRNTGAPLAAADLTWSYSAFLTATARRAGRVPASWSAGTGNTLPNSCAAITVAGTYTTATNTIFPPSQTPGTPSPTSSSAPQPTSCSEVLVTFNQRASTEWGQNIKLVGNHPALGNWNPSKGVLLNSGQYTPSNPLWSISVLLPAGQRIEYKYVNVQADGSVRWESDPNRSFSVPETCNEVVRGDSWK